MYEVPGGVRLAGTEGRVLGARGGKGDGEFRGDRALQMDMLMLHD